MNINFYHCEENLLKSSALLLLKLIEAKKRFLVLSDGPKENEELDKFFWSFAKIKFLPHLTAEDLEKYKANPLKQPVVISHTAENVSSAKNLVIYQPFNQESNKKFLESFEQVFFFFDENNIKEARTFWKKCRDNKQENSTLKYFKQEKEGWAQKE